MRRLLVGAACLSLFGATLFSSGFQPPDGIEKKAGPPRYQPGDLFPPSAREGLKLTDKQVKEIDELQESVKEKLKKILTPEQLQFLEEFRPPRGPGIEGKDGPGDKKGPKENGDREKDGNDKGGKDKTGKGDGPDGGKKGDRPDRPPVG